MFHTLFSTFLRNLKKDKVYSIINVVGFTVGMASFILILLFVSFELSYDRYHEKADRTYRLCIKAMIGDTRINQTFSSARIFREMKESYHEIEEGVKLIDVEDVFMRRGEKIYSDPKMAFADSTFFDVFTCPLVSGNPEKALANPNTLVVSESQAKKLFGNESPMGQLLEMDLPTIGKTQFEVTGVYRDIPDNSHFHFNMIGSLVSFPDLIHQEGWSYNNFRTYFVLHPNADPKALEAKFKDYVIESFGQEQYSEWTTQGNFWEFFLQPLPDIHLHSDLNGEFETNGNIKYVYIFSIIAFFVLIIACINFMNISTARSIKRSREVGIRKVAGSTRTMLIVQFLTESVILTLFALALALLLVQLVLPGYNDWLGKELGWSIFHHWWVVPLFIAAGLMIGVVSGLYPAFFLASYRPIKVLKSQTVPSRGGVGLRNGLVILQFAASIFLIIGTLVVNRQMGFLQHSDLGFKKSDVLVIKTPPSFSPVYDAFKQEASSMAGVEAVASCTSLPGRSFNNIGFRAEGVEQSFTLNLFAGDFDIGEVLRLQLVEGRLFDEAFPTDTAGLIINETAAKVLKLDHPLGVQFSTNSATDPYYKVIGVVKDFNYESMHSEVRPMGIFHMAGPMGGIPSYVSIRYDQGASVQVQQGAKKIWDRMMPGSPFMFSYLEDDYDNLYQNEKQTAQVFGLLALLAILVASLGLLGLAAFMTQQKARQIAVRKVFGATIFQIVRLLTMRFTRWVMIAFVIAVPIAWWFMTKWLQNFQYKTNLVWWIFLLAGVIAMSIAIITISSVTYRAARINPAESLKYE